MNESESFEIAEPESLEFDESLESKLNPMYHSIMKNSILIILFLTTLNSFSQSPIFDLNKKLGRGVNMGNMFEAPTETEWGNPFKDDYFQRIANLGFNHVRIPIRWDTPARTQQTSPYTINKTFLDRIKFVVDKALSEKLYVVINMHHHDEIFQNPDAVKPRFLSQWKQITEYFKDYDNRLIFEVMNEPNTNLTADKWNTFFADALAEIRKINKTRAVLMGTSNWGGLGGISQLKFPKDENLIMTIHYYDPFNFTHQGAEWVANSNPWLGTKWENTNLEREEIIKQFQYAISFAKQSNVPIHIGEFGAYSKADLDSRAKWTNFLARWFEEQGFSWAYWEFSAGFGIYNPSNGQYSTPLVNALLKDPISQPVVVNTKKVFESKFDANDSEWVLSVQPQAKATYTKASGTASIDVTQSSKDGWHVQFIKNDIVLKKGSRYMVSFEGSANVDAPVSNYLGKASDPWNAYSGYKAYTLTKDNQSFNYTFTMQENDDSKARIVFDLASVTTKFAIKNVIIQEVLPNVVVTPPPLLSNEDTAPQVELYPNPAVDDLVLREISRFKKVSLQDLNGKEIYSEILNGENEKRLSLKSLQTNRFIVILYNEREKIAKKIVRF
jgi:endoglucanase